MKIGPPFDPVCVTACCPVGGFWTIICSLKGVPATDPRVEPRDIRDQTAQARQKVLLLHPRTIELCLRQLSTSVEGDDLVQRRAGLAKIMRPLVLAPEADGAYVVTGGLDLQIRLNRVSGEPVVKKV